MLLYLRVNRRRPVFVHLWGKVVNSYTEGAAMDMKTWSQGREKCPVFTHCSSFIKHFIKHVDEHLLFD